MAQHPAAYGKYIIVNKATKACLDAKVEEVDQFSEDQPRIFLNGDYGKEDSFSEKSRLWRLYPARREHKEFVFYLVNKHEEKRALSGAEEDVEQHDEEHPTPFLTEFDKGTDAQKWQFKPVKKEDKTFFIVNLETGKCLNGSDSDDIPQNDEEHKSPTLCEKDSEEDAHKWKLIPASGVKNGKFTIWNKANHKFLDANIEEVEQEDEDHKRIWMNEEEGEESQHWIFTRVAKDQYVIETEHTKTDDDDNMCLDGKEREVPQTDKKHKAPFLAKAPNLEEDIEEDLEEESSSSSSSSDKEEGEEDPFKQRLKRVKKFRRWRLINAGKKSFLIQNVKTSHILNGSEKENVKQADEEHKTPTLHKVQNQVAKRHLFKWKIRKAEEESSSSDSSESDSD